MEFALSEDQTMFQSSVKGYLETACPLDAVRAVANGEAETAETITDGLSELGADQIMVGEAHGGLGLGLLDAALVQEMLGAAAAPCSFMAQTLAAIGVERAGAEDQKARWLPDIAAGKARFAIAVTERFGAREDAGVRAEGGALSGRSLFVLGAGAASHALVCDTDGALHVVDMNADGLAQKALLTIDRTRDYAELTFDGVPATRLSGENEAGRAAYRMVAAGRILTAADTLGAAQTMLDRAVAYAMERKQFGRVIAGFQAVKHLCAEMAAKLEPARALVWHAAHAFDENMEDAQVTACLAKAHLAEVGTFIARTATEVHGGMGFTDLLGLHYWFKRIGANRQLLGGPELVREHAARLQGWA